MLRLISTRDVSATAVPRSPLLIAATLITEAIPTGPLRSVSAVSQERRTAAAALSFRSVLFLTQAADEPRQFQQIDRAGSEIVKAIEHPVNFQNKNTLPIEHGHKTLPFIDRERRVIKNAPKAWKADIWAHFGF